MIISLITCAKTLNDTTLKGGKAVDAAIKAGSGSKFKNFAAVKKKFLADIKSATNWHTFLVKKCGIILDNADTGAISGSDAGGTQKTATSVIPCEGEAQYPDGTSFTVDGLTIYGIPSKKFLTADQQYVIQGLYSWWIKDSLDLIKESYGFSFTDADTTNSRLKMKFIDDPEDTSLAYVSYSNVDGDEKKTYESRELCVNMAHFKDMSESDRHGITEDGESLDRTLVHELTHGLMASNINYFSALPDYLAEGGSAELIHGIDDERYGSIIEYAQTPEVFEKILTSEVFEEPPIEIYSGGYMFMRYFAKQASGYKSEYDTYRKTVSVKSNFATNYWDTVTMKGGKGNDTITNSGNNVSVTAGAGNDLIKTYSDDVTVSAGNGNDSIVNEGDSAKLNGNAGNDSIYNGNNYYFYGGSYVTISGGSGNDYIENYGDDSSILGGDGKDTIINAGANSKIDGGTGNDSIENSTAGKNSTVDGGAGNDYIISEAENSSILGGDGDDTIENLISSVTIDGGAGNDSINNVIAQILIYGGDGDDSIKNFAYEVKIYGEDGADVIKNTGESASVYGGAGIDYVENTGEDAYISLGDDDDEILSYADYILAKGGSGDDIFTNFGDESTISGGDGDDEVENYGDYSSLAGDAGADIIYSSGQQSTLNGGENNDFLYNEGVYAYLIGGKGNDTLYNEGDHVTMSGGTGNDVIFNEDGRHIYYKFGKSDGKDTIYGFNDGDTIKITSGTHKTAKSGDNVIITVGNAKMTLEGAADKEINIISSSGKASTVNYSSASADLLWFAEETEFATENNLSSLIQADSAEYVPYKFNDSMKLPAEAAFTSELSFAREK